MARVGLAAAGRRQAAPNVDFPVPVRRLPDRVRRCPCRYRAANYSGGPLGRYTGFIALFFLGLNLGNISGFHLIIGRHSADGHIYNESGQHSGCSTQLSTRTARGRGSRQWVQDEDDALT